MTKLRQLQMRMVLPVGEGKVMSIYELEGSIFMLDGEYYKFDKMTAIQDQTLVGKCLQRVKLLFTEVEYDNTILELLAYDFNMLASMAVEPVEFLYNMR